MLSGRAKTAMLTRAECRSQSSFALWREIKSRHRTRGAAAISETRPIANASLASSLSARTNTSKALARPIKFERRCVPPQPVMSPRAAPRCPRSHSRSTHESRRRGLGRARLPCSSLRSRRKPKQESNRSGSLSADRLARTQEHLYSTRSNFV